MNCWRTQLGLSSFFLSMSAALREHINTILPAERWLNYLRWWKYFTLRAEHRKTKVKEGRIKLGATQNDMMKIESLTFHIIDYIGNNNNKCIESWTMVWQRWEGLCVCLASVLLVISWWCGSVYAHRLNWRLYTGDRIRQSGPFYIHSVRSLKIRTSHSGLSF